MGYPAIQPTVIKELISTGKGDYDIEYLAEACGLELPQVRNAMRTIIQDKRLPGVTVLSRGRIWRYEPDGTEQRSTAQGPQIPDVSTEPKWYYEVGTVKGGAPIVRAEGDPTLYVLKPLDV